MKTRSLAVLVLVTCFFALTSWATPVGTNDAARAVRAWVKRGGTLGARLGRDVVSVGIHATTNGVKFYSVQTRGGGTVFTSADDALEPILAFTSENAAEAARNPNSPLYALLNRDVIARTPSASKLKLTTSSATPSKWAKLLAEADKDEADAAKGKLKLTTSASVQTVGDLRVPPLVETKWGQQTDGNGNPCYNRYVPNGYYCGCVATAMAQIMRCHQWPKASVASVTKICSVDGTQYNYASLGGTYDWANMPLDPNGEDAAAMTAVQLEAIGRLCYDAGVSVRMDWAADGSASYSALVGEALRDVFGYGSAYSSEGKETAEDVDGISRKILSNLSAGYPVLLGISYVNWQSKKTDGHAIVGDGYGYNDETLYVHLNMGWYGANDVWYQLPDIGETREHLYFNCLDDIVYNIIPGGSDLKAVLAGRITLPTGAPASGAAVAIHVEGSEKALTNVTANAYGVYGVVLPSGATYEVRASVGALVGAQAMEPQLEAPTLSNYEFSGLVGTTVVHFSTTKFVRKSAAAGNAMNVDVMLSGTPSTTPLSWTEPTTLAATQFSAYNHTFTVTGGDTPYAWTAIETYTRNDGGESTYDPTCGTTPYTYEDFDNEDGGVNLELGFEFPFGGQLHTSVFLTQQSLTLGSDEIRSTYGSYADAIRVERTTDSLTVDFGGEAFTLHAGGTITVAFATEIESAEPTLSVFGKSLPFPAEKAGGEMSDITLVRQGLPLGISLNGATGVLSGKPEFAGNQDFDVVVTDPFGKALTNTFTLAVAEPTNRKPVITSIDGRPASGSMLLGSGANQTFAVHVSDPDGDAVTIRMYVNGVLRSCASDVPGTGAYYVNFHFSSDLLNGGERNNTIRITVSDSTWPEKVGSVWEVNIFRDWYADAETVEWEYQDGTTEFPLSPGGLLYASIGDGDTVYMKQGAYNQLQVRRDIHVTYVATDFPEVTQVAGIKNMNEETGDVYTNGVFCGFLVVGDSVRGGQLENCRILDVTEKEFDMTLGEEFPAVAVKSSHLVNCVVAGNTNGTNAVVASTLYNCTVADNGGRGLDADSTAYNSIFWGNGDGNVAEGATLVSCCTDEDPLFADIATGDYRLAEGSPCLDTGDNAYVPEGVTNDLAGAARIQNGIVDKGAFEGAVEGPEPEPTLRTWMTVDLKTGLVSYHDYDFATATNTFNTEEYKSTKMAFRRIEAGDSYYVQNGAYTAQMTNAYYIGLFEVTVAQYELIKNTAYVFPGNEALRTQGSIRRETVRGNKSAPSAFGALITAESPLGQLNARVQTAMGNDKLVFDLPTEAMWEVAARAVDSSEETQKMWSWHFGETKANLDAYAFWGSKTAADSYGNDSGMRVPGCKLPNAWGLYDMYGNAAEICLDGADGYNLPDASKVAWSETPQVSGDGDAELKYRNQRTRGGYYGSDAADASSLNRCHQTNSNYAWCGIRLALICLDEVVPVPPGGDVNVPSGYESADEFAEALNTGTADKSEYLKAPGDVTTTPEYLSYFSAVPSGEATVAFVLNDDGTNAVKAAVEVASTNALAVVLSSSSTLTIADPLVGFYYSLKQGGAVTNLHFNAEGDRNKLGRSVPINFDLIKPEGAGFYQPLVTPTEVPVE